MSIHAPKILPINVKWKPPPKQEWLKANYDGTVFLDSDEAGLGMVIRNDSGKVMAAFSEKIPLPCSVEILELLAVRRAVQLAVELDFHQVCFEGDSEIVFKALSLDPTPHSLLGHIVKL
nr:uncharacterized protein LOC112003847 [Quercus suber]